MAFSEPLLRKMAGLASVSVAAFLMLIKIAAYFYTGSVALLSSLIDSSVDLLSSLLTSFGINKALEPPDKDHRFGHGKAEALTSLAQAAFIIGSSLFLILEALERFFTPAPVSHLGFGSAVILIAIFLTAALLTFQTYVIKKTNSLAVRADRMHYAGDIFINLAVLASFFMQSFYALPWVDSSVAILIALFLVWNAKGIAKEAIAVLMDREASEETRQKIRELTLSVQGVLGAHDLRTRSDGMRTIIEIHIEMNPDLSLREAHKIVEAVENKILEAFPSSDILVHQDPLGVEENRLDDLIEERD